MQHRNTHPHLIESAMKLNFEKRPSTKSAHKEPKRKKEERFEKMKKSGHYEIFFSPFLIKVSGCVVTCSKNVKTVREMGDDKDIPKVGKRIYKFWITSGCRRIDKPFVVSTLRSFQFGHP